MYTLRHAATLAGLALVLTGVAQAQARYQIQPLVKLGDVVGDTVLPSGGGYQFWLGSLSDNGQLSIALGTPSGGRPEMLLQYADGKFTTIVAAGQEAPSGTWPANVTVNWPISMNRSGNILFTASRGSSTSIGTFLWDAAARKVTPVVLKDMPATGDLVFTVPGAFSPAINNLGDMFLVGTVKGPTTPAGIGMFFLGRDGKMQPIVLPRQDLPGVGKIDAGYVGPEATVSDEETVAFIAPKQGQSGRRTAFLWQQGTLTPLVQPDTEVPGGGKIHGVSSVTVNNKNRDVLISASLVGAASRHGLYRFGDGTLTPIAVPGQEMPGSGRLRSAAPAGSTARASISTASDAGEHVFWASLEDGATAAYRIDVAGSLSLIVKSGDKTNVGTITHVGLNCPPAINSQGQIALTLTIDNGPNTLALLTPAGL